MSFRAIASPGAASPGAASPGAASPGAASAASLPRGVSCGWALWRGLALWAVLSVCAWSAPVYVITDGAKVRSGLDASAAVVATLNKGAALEALTQTGARWKVKISSGPEGYISRLQVSASKPSDGGSALSGLTRAEVNANEKEMTQSIQGLNNNSETMAATGKLRPECKGWVSKMETESAAIKKENVDKFLAEGGIGL